MNHQSDPSLPRADSRHTHALNIGPGGCVPWDHMATWMRRMMIHVRALESAGNIEGVSAYDLDPLRCVTGTIKDEIEHAMAVLHIEDAAHA